MEVSDAVSDDFRLGLMAWKPRKRRYMAEAPDPAHWELVREDDLWRLYRALLVNEGWRNYRLIHRKAVRTRVSFRIGWSLANERFDAGRDVIYLINKHIRLLRWISDYERAEP